LLILTVMMIITFAILTFRMIMSISIQFYDNEYFNSATASYWGSAMNTVWVTIMNLVYQRLAVALNDWTNYRTETEYEDALIFKTFLFQFFNSYTALFYLAFVKGLGIPLFNAFGYENDEGNVYNDMCGKRGTEWYSALSSDTCNPEADLSSGTDCRFIFVQESCIDDLRTQMIFYTLAKPAYEIPLQILIPWLSTVAIPWLKKAVRRKATNWCGDCFKAATEAGTEIVHRAAQATGLEDVTLEAPESDEAKEEKLALSLNEQLMMPRFQGTFYEYNTKAVQYGYVAMFAAAFPIAPLAAAAANFLELRTDAFKLGYQLRRPLYWGAQDIGTWQQVLSSLSFLAILVNILIIAYTDYALRNDFIIPIIAGNEDTCRHPFDFPANVSSWSDKCKDNVKVCFEYIGGVDWLPASRFLSFNASTSQEFVDSGLCNEDSLLYDQPFCDWCKAQTNKVQLYQAWFVIFMEHFLVLLKVFVSWVVPDTPGYVVREKAKTKFVEDWDHPFHRSEESFRAHEEEQESVRATVSGNV